MPPANSYAVAGGPLGFLVAKTMQSQIIFDFYNTLFNPKAKTLFGGTIPLLCQLKKAYKLSLITTGGQNRKQLINKLGIAKYFSRVVICPTKSPKVFLKLIDKSSNALIIGDRKEEEISIAKVLKLPYIQVTPQLENPVKTITSQLLP